MEIQKIQIVVEIDKESTKDWCGLRRWLKVMLRNYGIKCISVDHAKENPATPIETKH